MLGKEAVESAIGVLEGASATIDTWLLIFTFIVAVGVVGEAVFGVAHLINAHKLQPLRERQAQLNALELSGLNSKIADANERAAEANRKAAEAALALEKYKAARVIKPGGLARITAALSPFAKTEFDVAVGPMGDPEPELLATAITSALTNAGWLQIAWKTSDAQLTLEKPGKPTFGFAAVTNVIVDIHPGQATRLWPIARAVAAALNAEGIAADAQQGSGGRNTNENAIHIMIGRKM